MFFCIQKEFDRSYKKTEKMHFWLTMKTASSHETAYVPYENNLRTLIHIEKQLAM